LGNGLLEAAIFADGGLLQDGPAKNVQKTEQSLAAPFQNRRMEPLERFTRNKRIIDDFALHTLAPIPTCFGRLLYIVSLRDLTTGDYSHQGLEDTYPVGGVNESLKYCHDEIFRQILELPLTAQEADLRRCCAQLEGGAGQLASRWLELEYFRLLIPLGTPNYLRELFNSNFRAILELIIADAGSATSDATSRVTPFRPNA
jgi:hypothetical protein